MRIEFGSLCNKPVIPQPDALQVGATSLPLAENCDFGGRPVSVPVQAVSQAAGWFTQSAPGCRVPFGVLAYAALAGPRALDFFFPITRALSEAEIIDFDQLLQSIAGNPNLRLSLTGEGGADLTKEMPAGIREFVAGHLAEVFYHQRSILDWFLSQPRKFDFYATEKAFEESGGRLGGDFQPRNKSIQLVLSRLYEGFFGTTPGVCPFLHEFGHMLDYASAPLGWMGMTDGMLPGMRLWNGAFFNPQARRLFLSGKRLELQRYLSRYRGTAGPTDPLPIGGWYVFQNDQEFIAGYFESYFRNPNYFAEQNPDLFQAFRELLGCDPRPAWPADFPDYINANRAYYLDGTQAIRRPGISVPWV